MKIELRPMTPRESRAAAVLLLAVCIAVLAAAVAVPTLALHRRYDDAIATRVDRLTREHRIIAMAPELERQLRDIAQRNPGQYYLRNANPVLAAAEIQEVAKRQVDANACKLLSMGILPPKDEAVDTKVGINVQLTCNLDSLEKVVYALETAKPYLFIDNLSIRSNAYAAPNAAPTAPDLQVQFDLSGYVTRKPA
jgi:general secretion pathway protein M